jgi:hypothetical protein
MPEIRKMSTVFIVYRRSVVFKGFPAVPFAVLSRASAYRTGIATLILDISGHSLGA